MNPVELSGLDRSERALLHAAAFPEWVEPMAATLTDTPFSSPDWLYERKLDGERVIAYWDGRSAGLFSRNRKDLGETYPELVEAVARSSGQPFVADGEVVAFKGRATSFSRLQARLGVSSAEEARRSRVRVYYYLFDLMHYAGYDLTALPLRRRKQLLRNGLSFAKPLRFMNHWNEHGKRHLATACERGWEGVIAKRADSAYLSRRSRQWLKLKCVSAQELVIAGFTDPHGERTGFGALLLGYYADGHLQYAGKVGTGFDERTLRHLRRRLDELAQSQSPYAEVPDEAGGGAHWVSPRLVAQIGFTEWTTDGRLRHPRFLGLRRDKDARDVVREEAE